MSDNIETDRLFDLDMDDLLLLDIGELTEGYENGYPVEKICGDEFEEDEETVQRSLSRLDEQGLIDQEVRCEDEEIEYCSLSKEGKEERRKLWDEIKDKTVTLVDDEDVVRLKIKEIRKTLDEETIMSVIQNIDEHKILDLRDNGKRSEPLIGREEELEELKGIFDDLRGEREKTVFISGDAGIGKTRLMEQFKEWVIGRDIDLLKGNCFQDVKTPYAPLNRAFEKISKIKREEETPMGVDRISRSSYEKVKNKKMFDAQRKSVFYGAIKFLKNFSESRSLVIFIEDLHWADKGTLNLLDYISDKLRDDPVVIVGTYRPGDVSQDHDLVRTMRRMSRKKLYREIELELLDKTEIEELVSEITGVDDVPESFLEGMVEKTNGNPLFVKESVIEMMKKGEIDVKKGEFPSGPRISSIPDIVQDVMENRIFGLDDETIEVLQLGSVIGREIPFDLLVQASRKDELELLEEIEPLFENKIWMEDPRKEVFLFTHGMVLDTVYKGLGKWLEKKRLHLKVAETIETCQAVELENGYSHLAYHYKKAEENEKAYEYLKKAAEEAEGIYAHEDAIERYQEALDITDSIDTLGEDDVCSLLEELGYLHKIVGEYEKSREHLQKALLKTSDLERQRSIYGKIANVWSLQGEFDKVINVTERGLELVDIDQIPVMGEEGEQETSSVDENTPEICDLLSNKGWALRRKGRYQEAKKVFSEELERAKKLDDKYTLAKAYHNLGSLERSKMKTEDCIDHLERSISLAEELLEEEESFKVKYQLSGSYNNLGATYALSGELDKAALYLERALDTHREIKNKISEVMTLSNLAILFKDRGDLEESADRLDEAFEILKKIDYKHGYLLAKGSQGALNIEKGNLDQALSDLETALGVAEELDFRFKIADFSNDVSKIYILKGDPDQAKKYAEEALKIGRDLKNERLIGTSLKNKGKAEKLEGNLEKSIELHEEAVEITKQGGEDRCLFDNRCELIENYLAKKDLEKAQEQLEILDGTDLVTEAMESDMKRTKGLFFDQKGDDEEAERFLMEALEGYQNISKRYMVARLNRELGELKRSKEGEKEAKKHLKKAEDLCESIGMEIPQYE